MRLHAKTLYKNFSFESSGSVCRIISITGHLYRNTIIMTLNSANEPENYQANIYPDNVSRHEIKKFF